MNHKITLALLMISFYNLPLNASANEINSPSLENIKLAKAENKEPKKQDKRINKTKVKKALKKTSKVLKQARKIVETNNEFHKELYKAEVQQKVARNALKENRLTDALELTLNAKELAREIIYITKWRLENNKQ